MNNIFFIIIIIGFWYGAVYHFHLVLKDY